MYNPSILNLALSCKCPASFDALPPFDTSVVLCPLETEIELLHLALPLSSSLDCYILAQKKGLLHQLSSLDSIYMNKKKFHQTLETTHTHPVSGGGGDTATLRLTVAAARCGNQKALPQQPPPPSSHPLLTRALNVPATRMAGGELYHRIRDL